MNFKALVLNQVKVLHVSKLTVPQPELRSGLFNMPAAVQWSVLCGTKLADKTKCKEQALTTVSVP